MRDNDVKNEIERMSNNRKEMIMGEGIIAIGNANRIILLTLINLRKYLKKDLEDYSKGKRLKPEDSFRHSELIAALDILIPYFGGTND